MSTSLCRGIRPTSRSSACAAGPVTVRHPPCAPDCAHSSVGSDTGGSVRLPAGLCGVFGYKSSVGQWSTEGVFPLSPTMDSIGVFTRHANDAALIFETVEGRAAMPPPPAARAPARSATAIFPRQLRSGRARQLRSGARQTAPPPTSKYSTSICRTSAGKFRSLPSCFSPNSPPSWAESVSRQVSPPSTALPWARIQGAIGATAETLVHVQSAQKRAVADGLVPLDIDALLVPTAPFQPCPVDDVRTLEAAVAWNIRSGQCTRPANFYGLCGTDHSNSGPRRASDRVADHGARRRRCRAPGDVANHRGRRRHPRSMTWQARRQR